MCIRDRYTDLAVSDIYPLHLHGDKFFNLLDEWFDSELMLGSFPPRDETLIRHSMTPVSYTHLPILLHDPVLFFTEKQSSLMKEGDIITDFFEIAHNMRPVSYTHLDVYKRQV